jgi:hypothetical protein
VVLIVTQALWRGVHLADGFFTQDDFLVLARVSDSRFEPEVLGATFAGGLSPGGYLVARLEFWLWSASWAPFATVMLALQAGAAALCWMVLSRLLGERWARIPLLAVFCFTPLTLWVTQWWTLSLAFFPACVLTLLAVWALLVRIQDDSTWGSAVVVAAYGGALLFNQRALLLPVVLFGVALALSEQPGVLARAREVLRSYAALWVALGIAGLTYAFVYSRSEASSLETPTQWDTAWEVASAYWRHLVPGLLGGPWVEEGSFDTAAAAAYWPGALGVAIALLLVGLVVQLKGGAALWVVIPLIVYVAGSLGLLLVTADGARDVALGVIPRAAADVLTAVVVLVAALIRGLHLPSSVFSRLPRWPSPPAWDAVLGLAIAAVFIGSAAYTTALTAPALHNEDDKEYVDNVRAALRADSQIVLLDGPVPEGVMSRLFGADARVSTVVGLVPEQPIFDVPSEKLREVSRDGTLASVQLESQVEMMPSASETCGYPIRQELTRIPLQSAVGPGRHILRLGYYTNREGYALVDMAGQRMRIPIRSGLRAIDLPVGGGFSDVGIVLEHANATVCMAAVTVGVPKPAAP